MELRFPTAQAISRLNRELHLPASGHEQDWEVELADPNRLDEFVAYYSSSDLSDDERLALLSLIVASAQDRVASDGPGLWLNEVLSLLRQHPALADSIVAQWLRGDWEITPYLQNCAQQERR